MANTTSNAVAPVSPCSCVAGCSNCVPGIVVAKPANPRNVALKAMRAAVPSRTVLPTSVLVAILNPAKVQRKPGSAAATRVAQGYKVGATVADMEKASPGVRADLVWDAQHGYIQLG